VRENLVFDSLIVLTTEIIAKTNANSNCLNEH